MGDGAPAGPRIDLAPGFTGRVRPGEGDTVLWLHGYTLDASSWEEMWRRLPGWRHVGIDLPGHGGSAPFRGEGDLHDLARALAALCEGEGVRHVVALSFGTILALQLAIDAPGALASLVLGAPSIAGGPQDAETARAYARLAALYHREAPAAALVEAWMASPPWAGLDTVPGLRERLGALVARHRWEELAAWSILQATRPPQTAEAIARAAAPTLLLLGEHELPCFQRCAEMLAAALPRVERVELPGTHHLCMLQSPGLAAGPIDRHLRAHALRAPAAPAIAG